MSTVATTAAVVSASSAVQNNGRIARQKRYCKDFMANYEHDHASVQEMQSYSECVGLLHPTEAEQSSELMVVKFFIVCIFVGIIGGLVKERSSSLWGRDYWLAGATGAFTGFIIAIVTGMIAILFI